jgi:hypothetical protein
MKTNTEVLSLAEERYLRGPIIQPRTGGWDFPDRLRAIVPVARWLQIFRGRKDNNEGNLASEEEALGYLSCASLEAPLDRDWVEICCYLSQQVFPRWGMIAPETEVAQALGLDRSVVLTTLQIEELRRFRRWLRQKTIDAAARSARR